MAEISEHTPQWSAVLTEAEREVFDGYPPAAVVAKLNSEELRPSALKLVLVGDIGEAALKLVGRAGEKAATSRRNHEREQRRAVVTDVRAADTERVGWFESLGFNRIRQIGHKGVDWVVMRSNVAEVLAAAQGEVSFS